MENIAELRRKTTQFLEVTLILQNAPQRQALIAAANLDSSLEALIEYTGNTKQFIQILILTLVKYGNLVNGRNPVGAVLEAAKLMVGPDHHKTADRLIVQWDKVGSSSMDELIPNDSDPKR